MAKDALIIFRISACSQILDKLYTPTKNDMIHIEITYNICMQVRKAHYTVKKGSSLTPSVCLTLRMIYFPQ